MRIIGLIRVDIEFESAGGVTAPEVFGAADMPLRRDRDSAAWLPPTSLAGSLRAHFGGRAEQFFGSPAPKGRSRSDDQRLMPSPVRVLGAETELPPDSGPSNRRSTAIDPRRGAAVPATLRSTEVLPAGTTVALFLRYDERRPAPEDAPPYDLDGFVDTVRTWRPVLGRGRSTGHGRARVTRVAVRRLDLRRREDLRAWLSGGRASLFPASTAGWDDVVHCGPSRPEKPLLALDFETVDVLHVGAGSRGSGPAAVMRVCSRPTIPATTWKGLLRSRCGFILRSCGQPACLVPARGVAACRTCLLCELFGWTVTVEDRDSVGHVGRLTFHNSPVAGTLGRRNHIGIDRFTGGVRSGLLFADEVVSDGRFSLRITMTRPSDTLLPAERGLLLMALRDLDDGLVGIGRSTTRGYGTVRLADRSRAVFDQLDSGGETGAAVLAMLKGAST